MPSKLERDIEEILAKLDTFPPRESSWKRARRRLVAFFGDIGRALPRLSLPRVSIGHVLLLGLLLIVVAYVFGGSLGSPSLVRLFIIGGILLFVGAFIFSMRRQSTSRLPEKRWRGEPMDNLDQPHDTEPWWKRWRSRR